MSTLTMFLPLAGGIYGALLGAYIKSGNRTRNRTRALAAAGIILALLCVATLVRAFAG